MRKNLKRNIWNTKIIDIKNTTDFKDILTGTQGKKGTNKRDKYDTESLSFRLGIMLKEARKEANLTQEELAERTGTKKSYISGIECVLTDIQVYTC